MRKCCDTSVPKFMQLLSTLGKDLHVQVSSVQCWTNCSVILCCDISWCILILRTVNLHVKMVRCGTARNWVMLQISWSNALEPLDNYFLHLTQLQSSSYSLRWCIWISMHPLHFIMRALCNNFTPKYCIATACPMAGRFSSPCLVIVQQDWCNEQENRDGKRGQVREAPKKKPVPQKVFFRNHIESLKDTKNML